MVERPCVFLPPSSSGEMGEYPEGGRGRGLLPHGAAAEWGSTPKGGGGAKPGGGSRGQQLENAGQLVEAQGQVHVLHCLDGSALEEVVLGAHDHDAATVLRYREAAEQ